MKYDVIKLKSFQFALDLSVKTIIFTEALPLGGPGGPCPPSHFNFRTKQGPTVSVSNITDIAFYRCSEIIRIGNFTIFTEYATMFGQFTAAFHFF